MTRTEQLAAELQPTAAALVCAVADRDNLYVHELLTALSTRELHGLAVILAGHVDPEKPFQAHVPMDAVVRFAIKIAAAWYRITEDHALTRRDIPAVNARSVACYVGHLAGMSSPAVGRELGRDHTTVLNAWGRVGSDPHLRRIATDIAVKLGIPVRPDEQDEEVLASWSRPGDPGRVQLNATGGAQTVMMAAELVAGIPGAQSFEIRYDALNRTLADHEEPTLEDRVRWEAVAVIRRKYGTRRVDTTYVGSAVVEPGGSHDRGQALAAADLLEQLGANTIVIDLTDDTDPRQAGTG